MSMNQIATMTLEAFESQKIRAKAEYGALATKWGVEAVGRHYPDQVTRVDRYSFARAGKWYVVRSGRRIAATAAQARALNRVGGDGVASIGPVRAKGGAHV